MKKKFYYYFYIFLLGSIFGWVIEGAFTLLKKGVFINHSALVIGPFNVIYGMGACILTILLYKYKDASNLKIFLISFISGSILEYIASLGMDLVLGFTAWDYSNKFLNINGRICLVYSLFWGVLGIVWIKYCYPFVIKIIDKLNYKVGKKLLIVLSIFLLMDAILTISAVSRAHAYDKGIEPKNNYERFLDKHFNSKYLKNMFNNNWE